MGLYIRNHFDGVDSLHSAPDLSDTWTCYDGHPSGKYAKSRLGLLHTAREQTQNSDC